MQTYYFANCRLIIDDSLVEPASQTLKGFSAPMPFSHTFVFRTGDASELEERYAEAQNAPVLFQSERFSIHEGGNGWMLTVPECGVTAQTVILCSRDYSENTVYYSPKEYVSPVTQTAQMQCFSFNNSIRHICEAGIALNTGIPLHASLVESGGFGIAFLGRSGIGKSTQAKLWQKYRGADFISGDRPCVMNADGVWYAGGMPWDGKDRIRRQTQVKLRAVVSLEQADCNEISRLNIRQALAVLLKQAAIPMWDSAAASAVTGRLGELARQIPFYHLKNLADEEGVRLVYRAVTEEM